MQTLDTESPEKKRLLWHWMTLGPYHFARMNAVALQPGINLTVVEDTSLDDHGWMSRGTRHFPLRTTHEGVARDEADSRVSAEQYASILRQFRPDAIVEGLCDLRAVAVALDYLREHPSTRLLLWSETTEWDRPRRRWRESIKKLILSQFDGCLVAGQVHGEYLRKLGFSEQRIVVGGGCVDNDFFRIRAERIRATGDVRTTVGTRRPYFLFVGRLVGVKNVDGLLAAYAQYRNSAITPWDLVIVGSGPQESTLRAIASEFGTEGVTFAGLRQPDDLAYFYANAGCFVLPSTIEPWGLVVNEAMACGLPVIISDRCGCGQDLVTEGISGFLYSPSDLDSLAGLMHKVSSPNFDRASMGAAAMESVARFSPERYGRAVLELLQKVFQFAAVRSRAAGLLQLKLARAALSTRDLSRAA